MSVVIGGTIRIPADKEEAFRPHMVEMMEATHKEDGCIEYAFSFDAACSSSVPATSENRRCAIATSSRSRERRSRAGSTQEIWECIPEDCYCHPRISCSGHSRGHGKLFLRRLQGEEESRPSSTGLQIRRHWQVDRGSGR